MWENGVYLRRGKISAVPVSRSFTQFPCPNLSEKLIAHKRQQKSRKTNRESKVSLVFLKSTSDGSSLPLNADRSDLTHRTALNQIGTVSHSEQLRNTLDKPKNPPNYMLDAFQFHCPSKLQNLPVGVGLSRPLGLNCGLHISGIARTGAVAGDSGAAGPRLRRSASAQARPLRRGDDGASRDQGRLEIRVVSD